MKTIIENSTGLSKYLLEDAATILLNSDHVVVGNPAQFIVADMNSSTATIYENVTAPADWAGNKYFFNGVEWSLNNEWVDPKTQENLNAD